MSAVGLTCLGPCAIFLQAVIGDDALGTTLAQDMASLAQQLR
jgi:hypothetical protein